MPLSMALVLSCTGWPALLSAAGSVLGYWLFWGSAGYQGLVWLLPAVPLSLLLGSERAGHRTPYLLPAVGALVVSAVGVIFQAWLGDTTPVGI